jgi:simple sugar transport system permease protein
MRSFSLVVERRHPPGIGLTLGILLIALAAGVLVAGLMFLLKGVSPLFALQKIFQASFGSWYGVKETVTKAIPLILISAGLSVAFRGRFYNIGAEGQLLFGAIAAVLVGLYAGAWLPKSLVIPVMFGAGSLAGAGWGLLPVVFRVRYGINEAISTLMMNYIAAEFVQYLIYGPLKGKSQFGFPYSDDLPAHALLPTWPGSRIHYYTLGFAILAAIGLEIMLRRSRLGFEIRTTGENPDAARYAGMNIGRTTFLLMMISGGLAGMAGVGEVAGIHRHLAYPWAISSGYGFTAIITAFLAKLNPALVIPSSLFFAGILVGGDAMQISLKLPFASVHVFNGLILLALLAGDFFLENRVRLVRRSPASPGEVPA